MFYLYIYVILLLYIKSKHIYHLQNVLTHHYARAHSLIHPKRPIPKGMFTVNQVYFMGTAFFCLGIISSYRLLLHQFALFLVVAVLGLSVIFLKLNSIVRAILTASMVFLLFPFSIFITPKSLLFGLIVAVPHVAGSITKDFIHRKGDERIGLQPPARWSRFVASSLFFVCEGIILLPIILNLVSWLYIPLIVPTFTSCLMLGYKVLKKQYPKVYIYGCIAMFSALVAFSINI